jgi:hypothetical protein
MHKYINSLTIHFCLGILSAFIVILVADNISLATICLLVFALPIWFTFYNRVKDMASEEISEKLGFRGNKFLDCTNE